VLLKESIVEVPVGAPASRPHRVREQLRADETAQYVNFVVGLRMRNLGELEARIHAGRTVPRPEMEARYLPLRADYSRVAAWLVGQGFKLTLSDSSHTNVFARGTVAQLSASLGVTFARVATVDGEFTSAVTAPSLPPDISGVVLGIDGLQPHILMHAPRPRASAANNVDGMVTPADILAAYNVPITLDGSGQTIAIIMDSAPQTTDLAAFWSGIGISSYASGHYTLINVNDGLHTGPTPSNQANDVGEVTLDTEWSTGMAPGAALRVYAIPSLSYLDLLAGCTQVLNDGIATIVSYSASGPEEGATLSSFSLNSAKFAQMAAAGITMLSSSGDSGSNPNTGSSNGYAASNAVSVMYPASDPNVTGVGGTTPTFNASWVETSEVVWSEIGTVTPNPLATGGGVSGIFSRPSWQTGTGVPAGTMRCVPDVAAMSSANPTTGDSGAFVVLGGNPNGFIGTSLSSPIWAGLTAVVNQARANAGRSTVGLLGPFVYPLILTSSFNDITAGNNGAYPAATGYDLCTGVGSPNVTNLIAQVAPQSQIGNTATGVQALNSITNGQYNTGNGYQALYNDTTGDNNTGVGTQALFSNTTGSQNVGIGYRTLYANTSGTYNTANGYDSLPANTTGTSNTASGFKSLFLNTGGSENTGNGYRTLFANTTGQDNTASGFNALQANSTGTQNTAIGSEALFANTTGAKNSAFGFQALFSNTGDGSGNGSSNVAVGGQALYSNTTGNDNAAAGCRALYSNTTGSYNVASGFQALYSNTGDGAGNGTANTAVGFEALYSNALGNDSAAVGYEALTSSTGGGYSVASGYEALFSATTGTFNTACGYQALGNTTSGSANVALGQGAGMAVTTGFYNIDIASPATAADNDVIRIGNGQTQTFISGIAGATASGGAAVYVNPSTGQLGTLTSSRRFKSDIKDMGRASEAIFALRPVAFRYRREVDPEGTPQFGLVAEEVEKVSPDLVVHDAQGRVYSVRYEAVNAMLLNEFVRQHGRLEAQAKVIAQQVRQSEAELGEVASQRERIAALVASQRDGAARGAEIEALKARLLALEKAIGSR
jgi:hypothetical protein